MFFADESFVVFMSVIGEGGSGGMRDGVHNFVSLATVLAVT